MREPHNQNFLRISKQYHLCDSVVAHTMTTEITWLMNNVLTSVRYVPVHDKTNKMTLAPAKTQISLGIRPVWAESSLSEDPLGPWLPIERTAKALIRLGGCQGWSWSESSLGAHVTCHIVGFVMHRLIRLSVWNAVMLDGKKFKLQISFIVYATILSNVTPRLNGTQNH